MGSCLSQTPGIETGTGNQSRGTVGTRSLRGERDKFSRDCPAGQAGPGQKITGLCRLLPTPDLNIFFLIRNFPGFILINSSLS